MFTDRINNSVEEIKYGKDVSFLYNNFFGRIILKLIYNRFISNIIGIYMNSSLSKRRINKAIKKYNIDMSIFEKKEYKSFNEFFIRYKKELIFDMDKNHFVSPCDSKLTVIKLDEDTSFKVKGSIYNMKNIIDEDISKDYKNGYALIFRLEINNYHHYHFVDDGTIGKNKYIKGVLHTVQPIALGKYKVFHKNAREYTVLHTKNFGDIIQVEVGALSVGRITNNKNIKSFKKGEEKGYFEFGGSTVILFVKDKSVFIDKDILNNSKKEIETIVNCGEKIGIKYKVDKNK